MLHTLVSIQRWPRYWRFMLKGLDDNGYFWIADKPENKVAGLLKTDGRQGSELTLIGSFSNSDLFGSESSKTVRILGFVGNNKVTLDSCMQTNLTRSYPGTDSETYHVPIVLEGAHFQNNDSLTFNGFQLQLWHLDHWIDLTGIEASYHRSPDGTLTPNLACSPPSTRTTQTDFGVLQLQFGFAEQPGHFEYKVTETRKFVVNFHKPHTLKQLLQLSGALQDLLTVGVDGLSTIEGLTLFHPDVDTVSKSGVVFQFPIKLHLEYRGKDLTDDKSTIVSPQMLFTFEDIGGLNGIVRWLEVSEEFKPAIGALTAQWYRPRMHTENRFTNAVTAAETFQRIQLQEQRVDLLKALRSLAQKAGDTFRVLVGDVDHWAKTVRDTRVLNVVHRGLNEDDEPELYLLAESVYFLVVLCLLQECGVPKDTLGRIQRHQRFRLLKEQIQATL